MKHAGYPEALTVAMAIAPGIYSRNRFFTLYERADVRRAKARALMIRSVVRQLGGAHGEVTEVVFNRTGAHVTLSFRIDQLGLKRRVELTPTEGSCIAYLAARARPNALLHATEEDRRTLDAALRRLAVGLELGSLEASTANP